MPKTSNLPFQKPILLKLQRKRIFGITQIRSTFLSQDNDLNLMRIKVSCVSMSPPENVLQTPRYLSMRNIPDLLQTILSVCFNEYFNSTIKTFLV